MKCICTIFSFLIFVSIVEGQTLRTSLQTNISNYEIFAHHGTRIVELKYQNQKGKFEYQMGLFYLYGNSNYLYLNDFWGRQGIIGGIRYYPVEEFKKLNLYVGSNLRVGDVRIEIFEYGPLTGTLMATEEHKAIIADLSFSSGFLLKLYKGLYADISLSMSQISNFTYSRERFFIYHPESNYDRGFIYENSTFFRLKWGLGYWF